MTLNAIATALEGRGDQIGENLETVDSYLKRFNPEIPALVEDLRLTAQVSDIYADVLPEVATILRNTITTTQTLEGREDKLNALFQDIGRFSATTERFLDANGDNLIRLGDLGRTQLRAPRQVLPAVPLPARGHRQGRRPAGRGLPRLHPAHRARDPAQPAARLRAAGRPRVRRHPRSPLRLAARPALEPGEPPGHPARLRRRHRRADRQGHLAQCHRLGSTGDRATGWSGGDGYAGGRDEAALLKGLLGTSIGTTAEDVPDLGVLLVGPDGARRHRHAGGGPLMPLLDAKTSVDLTKLMIFILVTTLATAVLVVTIGNLTFGATRDYRAEFVNATGVVKGDDIRVAGVKVGVVKDIEIVDRTRAMVSFTVDDDTAVTGGTFATIRYRNLVGQRYISLTQEIGDTARLPDNATIPVDRTKPALDLTVLFNGFKPLFQALSPTDINQLSYEIVQVFQGESGTLEGLLQHTASVTSTLADRDEVISDLIENLNQVLVHIGDRDEQLSRLIGSFRTAHRRAQGRPAGHPRLPARRSPTSRSRPPACSPGIRKPFVQDIKQLRTVAGNIDKNKAELDRALQVLPIKLEKVGRTAIYGSWFNFYLCEFQGRVKLPGNLNVPVSYQPGSDRCDLG